MISVSSDIDTTTAGYCADCGKIVMRRTPLFDEQVKVTREVCIRWQFESGCCG